MEMNFTVQENDVLCYYIIDMSFNSQATTQLRNHLCVIINKDTIYLD